MNKTRYKFILWVDRLLSKSIWKQFSILGIALLILFLISWFFSDISGCNWDSIYPPDQYGHRPEHPHDFLLPLYLLIDANALSNLYTNGVHGWALLVSSIIYVIGLFIFNGMIISVLTNSIEQRVKAYREGHIHYLKSGHYIIMGYDDMVPSIITYIFEKKDDAYVLLMSGAESEQIQEKLRKVFSKKQLSHIIINFGHRMSKDYYKDIHLESAEQVFIIGMRSLPAHDAINVECVDRICAYLNQDGITDRPKRIICVFEDLDTYAAFQTSEIFDQVDKLGIEFIPYNFYAGWAKQVFIKRFHKDIDQPGKNVEYPTVYGQGISVDDPKYVHIVFIGTSSFAIAFALEAANVLHFPNFKKGKGPRTRISFIDINADKEKDVFITRFRHFFEVQAYKYEDLSDNPAPIPADTGSEYLKFTGNDANFLDVEFEFIKGDVFSFKVQNLIKEWAKDTDNQYLSIFIAQNDQRRNFIFGMNMPDEVYDNGINVFLRQDRSDNFVANLRKADESTLYDDKKNTYTRIEDGKVIQKLMGGRYSHIYPFGMNETAYSADEKSLKRAKLINFLYHTKPAPNQFQSLSALKALPDSQIWKEADEYWRPLSVALKWSNLYNAYAIRIKQSSLRAVRGLAQSDTSLDEQPLTDKELDIIAQVEHNRWNVEKLLMGYRKPLPEEDKYLPENAKFQDVLRNNKNRFIHHDIRPYDNLDEIRQLDVEFSRYIPWIMTMTDRA